MKILATPVTMTIIVHRHFVQKLTMTTGFLSSHRVPLLILTIVCTTYYVTLICILIGASHKVYCRMHEVRVKQSVKLHCEKQACPTRSVVATLFKRSFLHVGHEIYIVSTMHCLSIVYRNPNPNLI